MIRLGYEHFDNYKRGFLSRLELYIGLALYIGRQASVREYFFRFKHQHFLRSGQW